ALEAALELEQDATHAEVIAPRTLTPLDLDTIAGSVRKTGRLVMVGECYARASFGEDLIRRVLEYRFENGRTGFTYLDGPPILLGGKHTPIPMSAPPKDAIMPTRDNRLTAVRS